MKRNNVAKRFGIASLCLGVALSAFSGIAPQTNSVALADGEVAVTDFVYTTAETVDSTSEKTLSDGTTSQGLRLTSDVAYEGTFKTVFTGDACLNFKFPETYNSTTAEYYGHFIVRVADADDDSNYFEIVYYSSATSTKMNTSAVLKYGDQVRSSKYNSATTWYNASASGSVDQASCPYFLNKSDSISNSANLPKLGYLEFLWEDDVLTVSRPGLNRSYLPLGAFDGTSTFKSGTSWGLPKLEGFKDGYTISFSSNITKYLKGGKTITGSQTTTDTGTDVFFTSITNKAFGDVLYDFSKETVAVDAGMTKFNETFATEDPTTEAGEVFLGWKDAEGLHATPSSGAMAHNLLRRSEYEEVTIAYDTIDGASVRIDTSGNTSGIRFMTTFDKDEYAAVEQYITERGTLVAVTSALDGSKDFTIANYQDEINANGNVKKMVNSKGVFDYEAQDGTIYKAYSMAITFEDVSTDYYTVKYSARGYLVVTYADGSTATIYTDYDADKNSRSIAQTAYNLTTVGKAEYDTYTTDQKTIVDTYAGYYNAN